MRKQVVLIFMVIFLVSQVSAFEFCDNGVVGENNIRLISVSDMLKENSREWVWESSQKVEIEVRVENKDDESGNYAIEAIFKNGETTVKIAQDSSDLESEFSLSSGERKSISLEFETKEDLEKNSYDVYFKFYKKGDEDKECVENSEEKVVIEKVEVCESDEVNEDELEISGINDEKKDNENSWVWTPGDDIEVSLVLENKDYSERDFTVELIFLDENNGIIDLVDNSDDVRSEKKLDRGESDEMNFDFKLRPDIQEARYSLYVKAYDSDNERICTSLKAESKSNPVLIKVNRLERKVIVTEVQGATAVETSSNHTYTAKLVNLGSEDEEKVLAVIYNNQLGILEKTEIGGLRAGEEKEVVFDVQIPENATLQRYAIVFSTEYEYRESQNYYRASSDEDDDIKYYVTVSQGEIQEQVAQENETVEEISNESVVESNESVVEGENESFVENVEDEALAPATIITGNVIGTSGEGPNWLVLIVLLILAIIGIVLLFRKPRARKETEIEPPRVIRRYTARLD